MQTGYHAELCGYDARLNVFEFNIHSDVSDDVLASYDIQNGIIYDSHIDHDYDEITGEAISYAEKENLFELCEAKFAEGQKQKEIKQGYKNP